MPTKLYRFKTLRQLLKWCKKRKYSLKACREAWTGPGYYYARSKNHISKHTPHLDKRRGGKVGKGPYRHIADKAKKAVVKLAKTVKKAVDSKAKKIAKKIHEETGKKISPTKIKKAIAIQALRRIKKKKREIPKSVLRLARELWESIPRKYKTGSNRIWTFASVIALAQTIRKYAPERLDWESVDWADRIDWATSYSEAKAQVLRLLGVSGTRYEDIPEEEIIKRLKEIEHYEDYDRELDQTREWEIKHMI